MARRPGADPTVRHGHGKGGGMRRLRKLLSGAVGIAALAASGVAMVHAYSEGRSSASGGAPVLIAADPGPFKVKPDSPGGRAVPDRDKRIYDRVAAAPQNRTPERLLPPPEVPLPRPRYEPEPPEEPVAAIPDPDPAEPETASPAKNTETAKAEAEARKPPAPLPEAEKYRLQLAALRSKAGVDKAWKRLRTRHSDLLSGLGLAVEKKDLGPPKGVYYRLLAGPVSDRKKALRLCADLEKRNVGCLVVRR
ncbi:MAG: SPOR domain-containing protein [Defluviicoccus sp.]|nr:SPOR domain-containing protein [Defluviicoccus sp.]MDE0277583.1 SPOR domain-containing protein [Defluviicoccus sp.]